MHGFVGRPGRKAMACRRARASGGSNRWVLRFDPRFERYARIDSRGDLILRSVADDELLSTLHGPSPLNRPAQFSPDGRFLAALYQPGGKGECYVWDLVRDNVILHTVALQDWWTVVAFSPDSRSVAVCGPDDAIRRYDLTDGKSLDILESASGAAAPNRVFFTSDGVLTAYRMEGTSVRIIEPATSRVVATFSHPKPIGEPAWLSDGKLLAVPCENDIYIWNVRTGRELNVLRGHQSKVTVLCFGNAGDLLASSGWDNTVRLSGPRSGA